jgi:hypothetical protein
VAASIPVRNEGYNHRTRTYWKLMYDASVRNTGTHQAYGHELVSPPLVGPAGFQALATAIKALRDAGATVDASCGIHVHHDMAGLSGAEIARFARLFYDRQDAIDMLVAPSRRHNGGYARRLREYEINTIVEHFTAYRSAPQVDRYRTLNVQSFPKYGTIEIRQHQGSLNAIKVAAWIKFGQALVQAAIDDIDDDLRTDIEGLLHDLGDRLGDDERQYLINRVNALA